LRWALRTFFEYEIQEYIRSDNGSRIGVYGRGNMTMANSPGREDGIHRTGKPLGEWHLESFNGKLRDELLNGEIFETLLEARVITEKRRRRDNTVRPHNSLGYRPPASETYIRRQVANA
jgi:hypothetical protein